jgi:hypothetical protein
MFAVAIRGLALPTCRTGKAIVQRADCTGNILENASRAAVGSSLSGMGWARTKVAACSAFSPRSAWLQIERLPGYAPELNPVEPLWGDLKGGELANLYVVDAEGDATSRGMTTTGQA